MFWIFSLLILPSDCPFWPGNEAVILLSSKPQSKPNSCDKNSNFTLQNTGVAGLQPPRSASLFVLLCDFGDSKLALQNTEEPHTTVLQIIQTIPLSFAQNVKHLGGSVCFVVWLLSSNHQESCAAHKFCWNSVTAHSFLRLAFIFSQFHIAANI